MELLENIGQYYILTIGNELYALEAERIKEIKVGYHKQINSVFNMSPSVAGVIDIGAEMVLVVDLQLKLKTRERLNKSQPNTMIIVDTISNQRIKKYGFIIDSCLAIANVRLKDTVETSLFKPDIKRLFVSGSFSQCEEIVKILDIDAIVSDVEQLSECC